MGGVDPAELHKATLTQLEKAGYRAVSPEHCPNCHHPDLDLCAWTCPWKPSGLPGVGEGR